jgi:hypothetical protein
MPCVYLPGPAPAVTVGNITKTTSLSRLNIVQNRYTVDLDWSFVFTGAPLIQYFSQSYFVFESVKMSELKEIGQGLTGSAF